MLRVINILFPASVALFMFCFCARDEKTQTLTPDYKIVLNNVRGRIDHMDVDLVHKRLLVCALGNNTIEIADFQTGKQIFTVHNIKEPQGIVYIPYTNRIVASAGGDGTLNLYDGNTFKLLNTIKGLPDADNLRYDSVVKKIYVGYGDGGIAIVDAINFTKIGDIKLPSHPESFQLAGNYMYINIPDKGIIAVADIEQLKIIAEWKISGASSNFPMALDTLQKRLFIGCRFPSKILIYNYIKSEYIGQVKCDGDIDDLFYNNTNKKLYASCGSGYLDIFIQEPGNKIVPGQRLLTVSRARTSLYSSGLKKLFVAIPASGSEAAYISVISDSKL
jgi:WD40 repeat protein